MCLPLGAVVSHGQSPRHSRAACAWKRTHAVLASPATWHAACTQDSPAHVPSCTTEDSTSLIMLACRPMLLGVTEDGTLRLLGTGSLQAGPVAAGSGQGWTLDAAALRLACHGPGPLLAVLCSRQVCTCLGSSCSAACCSYRTAAEARLMTQQQAHSASALLVFSKVVLHRSPTQAPTGGPRQAAKQCSPVRTSARLLLPA